MSEEKEKRNKLAVNPLAITQHCKERYAERIMNREDRSDIAVFVAQNQEKIETDINKLYEYSQIIYTGQLKDKNYVNVFLNGSWVLLTDKDMQRAITMYKIDFGLGEEFNKEFVNRMLVKIDSYRQQYCDALNESEKQKKEYEKIISDFTQKANDYRRMANNLDKQVAAYKELASTTDAGVFEKENSFRQAVMELVCKKEF